ncbi:hypothetical protein KXW25_004272 [Aspergillus fumigatus]|nr:hypothetical protein KXW25_004272 [Aspergillus fumigatus]
MKSMNNTTSDRYAHLDKLTQDLFVPIVELKRQQNINDGHPHLNKFLDDLSLPVFQFKCRRTSEALASRSRRCLLIDGQPIGDICTSGKYSKEDIESLNRHRKDKYPHLMLAILAYVLETGCSPDGADIDDFGERVNKALAADREEAAQDNCIWASMEWRWQEHANRPK